MLAVLLSLSACATTPARSSAPDLPPPLPSADWTRARADLASLLAKLIQVDTTNPPGSERAAAILLSSALEPAGVTVELVPAGPGRATVFARLAAPRATRAALVLVSHLDVPAAEPAAWPEDARPFSGAVKEGAIWGRGALGAKGLAALHAVALAMVARSGVALDREVLLISAADAERGGHRGVEALMARRPELLTAGIALGEGGYTVVGAFEEGLTVHAIATGEKGFAEVEVVAEGSGRGLDGISAPIRLARALARLAEKPPKPVLTQPAIDLLGFASVEMGFPTSLVLRSPALTRAFALSGLAETPWVGSMLVDQVAVERVAAGDSVDRARATLFATLVPGSTPGALRASLASAIGDARVHVTIADGEEASGSAFDAAIFQAIATRAARGGREVAVPALSPARTDLRYFRRHGIPAYGFTPFAATPSELESLRGRDEKVPIAELERGLEVIVGLILDLATTPDGSAASPSPR